MKANQFLFAAMLVFMAVGQAVMAQTYRSNAGGNWTSLSTWQVQVGESWAAATSFPGQTSTNAVVTIRANDQVYINPGANITIQDINVEALGKVTLHPGGKIIIADKMQLAGSDAAAIVVDNTAPTGTIASLVCSGGTISGTLTEGTAAAGTSFIVGYTGGNSGNHFGQTVASTGVTGLTAVLESGTFANGNGQLTYIITGTPANSGTARFALTIGGQNCNVDFTVDPLADPNTFTDSRDGQTYKWVEIGNQVWMAENLKYLPSVVEAVTGSETTPYYYVYGYNGTDVSAAKAEDNYKNYGVLSNWAAVMSGSETSSANPSGVQGVCPTGWHVPSDAGWTELVNYVVSQGYPNDNVVGGAGNALKSCRQENSPLGGACSTSDHPRWGYSSTRYGTDNFGFSALPSGYRDTGGSFNYLGSNGYWWSATEYSSTLAWGRLLNYDYGSVHRKYYDKANGFSLRCVRD